jgi:alpha-L-fucosidase
MKLLSTIVCFFLFFFVCNAQPGYQPTPENLAARKWFDSARFGMFIHWGAFSVPGSGEWVMQERNIPYTEYSRLQTIFNPVRFDAKKWVSAAKRGGMQYITLITRHHDGFSDWDTKQSDWKITNTDWKQDAVKLIAEECRRQGIKLFVYYSLLDWSRSDYQYETGRTGHGTGRTTKSDWNHYIAFMKAQLTELLTQYGPVAGVWFDGYWDQLSNDQDKRNEPAVDWHLPEIYALIHQLQPQCLIGNNHHLSPIPGEDFQMFEKDLPGKNTTGFGGASVSTLPLETCETINNSWGFNITDTHYKSSKELIRLLVTDAGYGANLLLNIGPLPNGEIQTAFTDRLDSIGRWLAKNGNTIYGTQGGYLKPQDWGVITEKGDLIYLHIFKSAGDKFFVKMPYEVKSAQMDGKTLRMQKLEDSYVMIDLKGIPLDPVDAIVQLVVIK